MLLAGQGPLLDGAHAAGSITTGTLSETPSMPYSPRSITEAVHSSSDP